MSRLQLDEVE